MSKSHLTPPLPPAELQGKRLPEWTAQDRRECEPTGWVWDYDRQDWTYQD
jgi:hypothetical protein